MTSAAPGGGAIVHFIHDQFGRLIAEHDGTTGAPLREYVWLGWAPIAFVDYSSGQPLTYYVHTDQVMNPQKLTDAAGLIVWDRVADPFGVEFSASGPLTLVPPLSTHPLRFPGQAEDDQTDLFQNWHRDYDPSLGRYVQSDPIGLMGGINTYIYVAANPIAYIDPRGLDWVYDQDSGQLTHYPISYGSQPPRNECQCSRPLDFEPDLDTEGYSGAPGSVNISAFQGIQGNGPLPQGGYTIGNPRTSKRTGRYVMDLTPDEGNEMFGRSWFQIHGDNAHQNQSASNGCIVLPRRTREYIAGSGDNRLWVTGSASGRSPRLID